MPEVKSTVEARALVDALRDIQNHFRGYKETGVTLEAQSVETLLSVTEVAINLAQIQANELLVHRARFEKEWALHQGRILN